jgi:hypothetical protein
MIKASRALANVASLIFEGGNAGEKIGKRQIRR